MRDDQRGSDEKAGSADRKTRVKGDRVIHTTKGMPYHGDRYEGPRGLTNEEKEERRVGAKVDERQGRETGFGGHNRKPPLSRLDGSDDVTSVKKGR